MLSCSMRLSWRLIFAHVSYIHCICTIRDNTRKFQNLYNHKDDLLFQKSAKYWKLKKKCTPDIFPVFLMFVSFPCLTISILTLSKCRVLSNFLPVGPKDVYLVLMFTVVRTSQRLAFCFICKNNMSHPALARKKMLFLGYQCWRNPPWYIVAQWLEHLLLVILGLILKRCLNTKMSPKRDSLRN